MRVKNQMSSRGTRPPQTKPVRSSADFRRQPVNSQPMGVSDLRERQPAQGSPNEKEGKPTNR
jgi:hypothetical protein